MILYFILQIGVETSHLELYSSCYLLVARLIRELTWRHDLQDLEWDPRCSRGPRDGLFCLMPQVTKRLCSTRDCLCWLCVCTVHFKSRAVWIYCDTFYALFVFYLHPRMNKNKILSIVSCHVFKTFLISQCSSVSGYLFLVIKQWGSWDFA